MTYQVDSVCVSLKDEETGDAVCLPIEIAVTDFEEQFFMNGTPKQMIVIVGLVELPIVDEEE